MIAQPTSNRSRQLIINEEAMPAGVPDDVKFKRTLPSINIRVISPDGTHTVQFTVTVKR